MRKARENRNTGVKVLRKRENRIIGVRIELNSKMTVSGKIIYAVVVTSLKNGHHYVVRTFDRVVDAWKMYKDAMAW